MLAMILDELNDSFTTVPATAAATRLLAAVVHCGVIGFECERREKPACLRTHMLVSMVACLFILVSQQLSTLPFGAPDAIRVDPLRLVEAVTAGVAFLTAGIIFTSGSKVKNITTGASMWLAGAVRLACRAGQMPLAAMATVIVVPVLIVLRAVERRMGAHPED